MPYLMVDLDDMADCRRGMQQLRRVLGNRGGFQRGEGPKAREDRAGNRGSQCDVEGESAPETRDKTPLKQKLQRIKRRGVWRFLSGIAQLDDTPRSLAEFDEALDLPRNKMRSTKAIFAKLENRLGVKFLRLAEDAGEDEAGNPRYVMPPRIRKAIRQLSD